MFENCLHARVNHRSIGLCQRFIFVDIENSLIDNLLKTNKVHYILLQKMVSKNCKYVIVHVKVPFYDIPNFLSCIEQLKKSMIICGYTDYLDFCVNQFRDIVKSMTVKSSLLIEEV